MSIKQVIVIRTDTTPPMRKGKMVAQGAHASMAFLTNRIRAVTSSNLGHSADEDIFQFLDLNSSMRTWIWGNFAKICAQATFSEIEEIELKARAAGLEVHLITDSGLTEFKEPTVTALAIGPDEAEKIDPFTRHLKLL